VKILDKGEGGYRSGDPRGKCLECGGITSGKPYCLEHLNLLPGTSELIEKIEGREQEIENAHTGKADVKGEIAADILSVLRFRKSSISPSALAKDVGLRGNVIEPFLVALQEVGKISISSTNGSISISLRR